MTTPSDKWQELEAKVLRLVEDRNRLLGENERLAHSLLEREREVQALRADLENQTVEKDRVKQRINLLIEKIDGLMASG